MKHIACLRSAGIVVATAGVALLVVPTRAFTVLGFGLDLGQRDVRVFNNFADQQANDNVSSDPMFPGAVGAPLAIWKAIVEWQSDLHGDGSGDPLQPGDLGSGGANFDATWQGLAPDAGGPSDNVISEISGSGAGLRTSTELGATGWRIRVYADDVVLDDGPGAPVAGAIDLQGLIAHEYGHVLGLGHSSVASSTMSPALSGNGTAARSIAADDRLGLQLVYGARSATKPRIASAQGAFVLTIAGEGFAPTDNEVWFTRRGVNATGEPVKVTGLASSDGGTKLVLSVPAAAGPGDVLVRIPGSGGDRLSNAYPWSPPSAPLRMRR